MTTEEKDDGSSVSFRLHDFLGYTTVHGAGRIVASRHWIRKICWVILILVTLGVLTSQIDNLYQMYQQRPLATHVAIEHDTSLDFPAITICDMNALRKEELKNYLPESLRIKLSSATEDDDEEEEEEEEEEEKVEEKEDNANDDDDDDEEEGDPSTLDKDYIDREYLRTKISEQKAEHLISLGHQFDDFVVFCTFKGVHCANYSSSLWNRFWHYAYGNCYVFNGGKQESGMDAEILKSNQPGPLHGLSLELNIEQEQYVGTITQEAGVRIDISNQGEMPFPFEKGLSLAPGYATSIGLRKVVIKRKDPLSRNRCMKNVSLDDVNIYKKLLQVNYSSTACKGSCLAYYQQKACGCIHYRFAAPPATNVCDVLNKTVARCISKVQKNFTENKLKCSESCPPPCSESTFKLSKSYSQWPTKSYEQIYKAALKRRNKDVDGSNNFRANVLKLDIFFEELNFEVISEEPSYELPNFISDLGGSLGLWIGMSVLSFAEIIELMLLTCYTLGKKFKRRITSGEVKAFEE